MDKSFRAGCRYYYQLTTAATSVTGLVAGIYRFELRVTDNNGAIDTDTMQVTVNAAATNIPPVANAGTDQSITLPINSVTLLVAVQIPME